MRAGRSSTLPIVVSTEPAEPPKVRWRLDIAYDGTNFSGWAAQAGLRTVLVLTGSTRRVDDSRFPYRPTRIVDSIADVVPIVAELAS